MKKSVSFLALMAGLALGTTEQALAAGRDIPIQGVTVLWSALQPAPTADDTIRIDNGGTLFVNVANAEVGKIYIGDSTTVGSLFFGTTAAR